ncbi:PAS domain-containing protein [Metabacillus malikii]|uniref:PAS domain-containing protein n=1 Tax=Metabacillus malikii TaxID=1504265 RepID=A0ABT9Z9J5_9BACI|nr:PAS domain-containing protein [Metabacillus malikii]MDQ0228928.1 PAS domain-containing protein [Metabacillus malikii]
MKRVPPLQHKIITEEEESIEIEANSIGIVYKNKFVIQTIMKNLTEQIQIKRELNLNQQRYESLFKHNPDGVYSLDLNGIFIDINHSCKRYLVIQNMKSCKNHSMNLLIMTT